jgi:DNA-directed RNA polymerase specialized sigma24 family protein
VKAPTEPHHDAGTIVTELIPRIRFYCREHLPKWARADAAQDTIVHLLERSAPAHDPTRGATFKTYLETCARNYVIEQARRIRRQRHAGPASLEHDPAGPDTSADAHVEQLAQLILDNPATYINSDFRAQLLAALVENPHAPRGAIAEILQVDVKKVWSTAYRLREEISGLLRAKSA